MQAKSEHNTTHRAPWWDGGGGGSWYRPQWSHPQFVMQWGDQLSREESAGSGGFRQQQSATIAKKEHQTQARTTYGERK